MRKTLKKISSLLFLVFTICACSIVTGCTEVYSTPPIAASSIANGETNSVADVHRKTVALYYLKYGDPWVFCSGVWVSSNDILTANHCAPDDDPGTPIRFAVKGDVSQDGEHFANLRMAFIAKRDSEHDLLLLQLSPAFVAPIHGIADLADNFYVGEPVQTDGHPLGLWWSYSTGLVSAVRRIDVGDDTIETHAMWIQSTAPISPGNSGGGLFDQEGNLLGICSRGPSRGQNLNLYVHLQYIKNFLASK